MLSMCSVHHILPTYLLDDVFRFDDDCVADHFPQRPAEQSSEARLVLVFQSLNHTGWLPFLVPQTSDNLVTSVTGSDRLIATKMHFKIFNVTCRHFRQTIIK